MTRNSKKAKPPKGSKCWYCGKVAVEMSSLPCPPRKGPIPICGDLDGCTRYMMERNGQPWGLSGGAK